MRTTVTLEPDTEHLLREAARATNRSFKHVLTEAIQQATGVVLEWMQTPMVRVLLPEPDHAERVFALLEKIGGGCLLLSDASLAVYAKRARATLCSNDGDSARFPGLDWINPLLKPI